MMNNCYQKHKERFRKGARERYQNLSEEELGKRRKNSEKEIEVLLNKKKKKGVIGLFLRNQSKS